jgi:hypothetical protein
VQRLADRGLLVDTVSNSEDTALSWAAREGHLDVVRFVVERGADVNRQNPHGCTPLMYAASGRHPQIVTFLLEHGADATIEDQHDRSALTIALDGQTARPWDATAEEVEALPVRSKRVISALTAAHPHGEAVVAHWKADAEEGERRWLRCFRRLYRLLQDYQGQQIFSDVLEPFIPHARETLSELAPYRRLNTPENPYEVHHWDLYQWYALGRVNDFLLLGFQAGDQLDWNGAFQSEYYREYMRNWHADLCDWHGPAIHPQEYLRFFEALGFRAFGTVPFSPFFHEVVEVVEDSSLPGIAVEHVFWPGLMFGEMLFSRAAVRVRCNHAVMRKEVAERSRLYFTFWRRRREASDLSHGWGSNSQWGNWLRRDYIHAGCFHYNVDGEYLLDETYWQRTRGEEGNRRSGEGLTLEARIELLTHRCLVRTAEPEHHYWPYNDRHIEPGASAWSHAIQAD